LLGLRFREKKIALALQLNITKYTWRGKKTGNKARKDTCRIISIISSKLD
jgi:hypothetical protein